MKKRDISFCQGERGLVRFAPLACRMMKIMSTQNANTVLFVVLW